MSPISRWLCALNWRVESSSGAWAPDRIAASPFWGAASARYLHDAKRKVLSVQVWFHTACLQANWQKAAVIRKTMMHTSSSDRQTDRHTDRQTNIHTDRGILQLPPQDCCCHAEGSEAVRWTLDSVRHRCGSGRYLSMGCMLLLGSATIWR